ncbi:hypothetical protein KC19_7G151400 [Ceratodon purpureus]|uniref:F-box domain-containing protein n=1 Tax=Ceratodon purpureus TaxID=3225 RepID=A0A8T0HBE8_CERPU|nr:hypothetical protein KC19_7G151400 [Ceratodon purpureus]
MANAKRNQSVQMGQHGFLQLPPQPVLENILNRLQDAKDVAKAQCVCKEFYHAGNNIRSLRLKVTRLRLTHQYCDSSDWFLRDQSPSLMMKKGLVQLHVKVEPIPQERNHVSEDEFFFSYSPMSDPSILMAWLPRVGHTLRHLSMKDDNVRTAMRLPSDIVYYLSRYCHQLKTLNLANMYIDISDCELFDSVTSLTLSCVRVKGNLHLINDIMPRLQHLAYGVSSDVASNLEVLELPKVTPIWSESGLKELKFQHWNIPVIGYLIDRNRTLMKIFWDIPPNKLFKEDIPYLVSNISKLHECGALEVLSVGPGLWRCMEKGVETLKRMKKWPSMNHLILHMIQVELDIIPAMTVLRMFLRPSVKHLTVYVCTSSMVKLDELKPAIEAVVSCRHQQIILKILTYDQSLDLSCFSF